MLAAKLLAAFREFKRNELLGRGEFFADKLHALHRSYLAASARLTESTEPRNSRPALVGATAHATLARQLADLKAEVTAALVSWVSRNGRLAMLLGVSFGGAIGG